MTQAKVSFTPSINPAVVGYNLHYAAANLPTYLVKNTIDLGVPAIVDGKMVASFEAPILDVQFYSVRAYLANGEESADSNVVKFDPRIEPPTDVVITRQ